MFSWWIPYSFNYNPRDIDDAVEFTYTSDCTLPFISLDHWTLELGAADRLAPGIRADQVKRNSSTWRLMKLRLCQRYVSTIHSELFLGLIGLRWVIYLDIITPVHYWLFRSGSSRAGRFNVEDCTDRCAVVFSPPRQYPLTSWQSYD